MGVQIILKVFKTSFQIQSKMFVVREYLLVSSIDDLQCGKVEIDDVMIDFSFVSK